MEKVIVIYSGGMDSFTLLNELHVNAYLDVHAVSFNYGQRHDKELEYARQVCDQLGIPHEVVDLKSITPLLKGSALTDNVAVPHGHYEADSMRATVVPNRNMIMISLAIAWAVSIEATRVYVGVHAGDHAIYPDCRQLFIDKMNDVSLAANYKPVRVIAPYINLSKGQIARIGKALGLNYGHAWTCYEGDHLACGKCGACQERIEAMQYAIVKDPMEYKK